MGIFTDTFVSVDGCRLHYGDAAAKAGTDAGTILLLHSGGASCRQYEAAAPLLSDAGYRVLAWDMLGHGDSDPLLGHRTMEQHAALVEGFAAALGLDRFILSGSSIGGYIAMAHAISGTRRLARLVVVEAPLRSPEWYAQNWAGFEAMCAIPDNSADELKGRFRSVTPELHKRWNIDRHKAGSWTMVDIAWACRDFDAAGAFAALRVPTSVVVGSNGPTLNEKARMEALRPGTRITVLDDCGHFPMIDDPAAFAAALLAAD